MKSKLIATSALAVVLAFGAAPAGTAFAQDTRQPSAVFNPDAERFPSRDGYYAANPSLILASDLIGKTLYSGAANNAESIGDVNDVIMGQNGDAQAIIIGVGGFLGIGEKDVAVDFSQVNWQVDANGNRVLVTALTKESLENAPSFDYALLERDYNRLTWGDPRVDGQGMQGQDMAARQPVTNDGTAVAPAQPGAAQPMGTTAQQQPVQQQPADGTQTQQMAQGQTGTAGQTTIVGQNYTGQAAAPVDRNTMQTIEMQEITAERVTGAAVYSAENENIGEVSEVLLTTDGQVAGFVVDVGGFLGMGERSVELQADQMQFSQDQNGNIAIWTNMSRQQLEQLPERQS